MTRTETHPARLVQRSAGLSPRARLLIGAVAAAAIVGALLAGFEPSRQDWAALLLLSALGMAAERFDISLYGDSRVSLSALFLLTAAIALGPQPLVVIGSAVALAGHLGRGRPVYKFLFNAGVFVVAALASAYVYRAVLGVSWWSGKPVDAGAALIAALSQFTVSSTLVAFIVSSTSTSPVGVVWKEKFAWLLPHFLAFGFLAFVLTLAYRSFASYGILAFVAPALMMRLSMKQYVDRTERTVTELREKHAEVQALSLELQEAYHDTLNAFVLALDTRDSETSGHSSRVTELSLALGEALGIERGSRDWLDLKHGAMLHDVGKIGVSDAILRKPGQLDDEEWRAIRQHPMHGYRMLCGVSFLRGAAELVLCHHERYDGQGYPGGLRAEDIPLAARIFAVADTFDAITSARPYKDARSAGEAYQEISRHSGTQFDPRVVAALLQLELHLSRAA